MDSITQAALGAAVAHISWHKQLGKKSLLWGAALGTLPDLDIVLFPILDEIQQMYWHRGESHSIFLSVLASLAIGFLLWKTRWGALMSLTRTITGVFLAYSTHILIDLFTIYGTQLFAPFSRYGFAIGNLFIIDPLYTVPLLVGILFAIFSSETLGAKANIAGLAISSLYALFSILSHQYADQVFKDQLAKEKVSVTKSITGATPMNTILWRHVAQTPEGLMVGYFSIFGDTPEEKINFELVPQNTHLIAPYEDQRNVQAVQWFSKGFWVARQNHDKLILSDVRFGEFRPSVYASPDDWQYNFSWEITDNADALTRRSFKINNTETALNQLWLRLWGKTNL